MKRGQMPAWLALLLVMGLAGACSSFLPSAALPTEVPPESPLPTSTIVTPPAAYATQDAARQTAIVTRATASPFPTAGPPTVQTGQPSVVTVRRAGLSLEVRLPKSVYLAGEGGQAEVILRNDGGETVFVIGRGSQIAWPTLVDDQGIEPAPWPWLSWSMLRGVPRLVELSPGQLVTDSLTFQVPPEDEPLSHTYTLWVEAQFSRPAPDQPQGPDNLWLRLEAGPIPLQVIAPAAGQQLQAELQANRYGWKLRVTDEKGRTPPGPFWGLLEATSIHGSHARSLADETDGAWSAELDPYLSQDGAQVAVRAWVAAPGYVTAVVTATVPGTSEADATFYAGEEPVRQSYNTLEAAQAASEFPLYRPGFLPAGAKIDKVQIETWASDDGYRAEATQLYRLGSREWLKLTQMVVSRPWADFGWGTARYDPEASVVAVGQVTGYATRRFGWWVLDWKCGDVGLELRAPVAALSLEGLVVIAARTNAPDGTCLPVSTPAPPTATPAPPTPTTVPSQIRWKAEVALVAALTAASTGLPAWSPDGSSLAFHNADGLALARAPDFAPQTVFTGPVLGAMWGEPGLLWQPDGSRLLFRSSTERDVEGQPVSVGTLGSVTPDGLDLRDLLPGWKATLSGPSYAIGLVGWLDSRTLAFHAHCGTECEYLYALDLATGDLLNLHIFGPRFFLQPGIPWIVAQHGPGGRINFTLVHRDSATIAAPDTPAPAWPPSAAITRTLPLPGTTGTAFADWADADGQQILAVAWDQGWIPAEGTAPDLYLWDLEADTATLFAPDVLDAARSPDGRYVALLVPGKLTVENGIYMGIHPQTGRAQSYSLVVLDMEEKRVRFSAEGPDVALDVWEFFHGRLRPQWSPRGTFLLFFDAAGELAMFRPETGRVSILTEGSGSLLLAAWQVNLTFSPDGRYLALTYDDETGPARIYIVDISRLIAGGE